MVVEGESGNLLEQKCVPQQKGWKAGLNLRETGNASRGRVLAHDVVEGVDGLKL